MIKAEDSELASLNLIKVSKIDIAGPTHSITVKSKGFLCFRGTQLKVIAHEENILF